MKQSDGSSMNRIYKIYKQCTKANYDMYTRKVLLSNDMIIEDILIGLNRSSEKLFVQTKRNQREHVRQRTAVVNSIR